jgi:hypothetical protein
MQSSEFKLTLKNIQEDFSFLLNSFYKPRIYLNKYIEDLKLEFDLAFSKHDRNLTNEAKNNWTKVIDTINKFEKESYNKISNKAFYDDYEHLKDLIDQIQDKKEEYEKFTNTIIEMNNRLMNQNCNQSFDQIKEFLLCKSNDELINICQSDFLYIQAYNKCLNDLKSDRKNFKLEKIKQLIIKTQFEVDKAIFSNRTLIKILLYNENNCEDNNINNHLFLLIANELFSQTGIEFLNG